MELSVVIVCWNGIELIGNCLASIYGGTRGIEFEVVVSDNGSSDGSVEFISRAYPQVRIVENCTNLGYAKGNNNAVRHCTGRYILLLNSDTVVHEGALQRLVAFADQHPEAGACGCEVVNTKGAPQVSARPFPTLWRDWLDAFCLPHFTRGNGHARKWQSGCCILFRAEVLKQLGGFDEQFFYSYEDVDLCQRVWDGGYSIAYTPDACITHLGSQSANRSPLRFELERHRSRYRYFYKHFGPGVLRQCRHAALARIRVRQLGYGLLNLLAPSHELQQKLKIFEVAGQWNRAVDPVRFVENGEEPGAASVNWDAALQNADFGAKK